MCPLVTTHSGAMAAIGAPATHVAELGGMLAVLRGDASEPRDVVVDRAWALARAAAAEPKPLTAARAHELDASVRMLAYAEHLGCAYGARLAPDLCASMRTSFPRAASNHAP